LKGVLKAVRPEEYTRDASGKGELLVFEDATAHNLWGVLHLQKTEVRECVGEREKSR